MLGDQASTSLNFYQEGETTHVRGGENRYLELVRADQASDHFSPLYLEGGIMPELGEVQLVRADQR